MQDALYLQQQALLAAGTLQGLMLAADQVARAVQSGAHGRKRAGFGEAFWQFRDYESQESASRIDWRQSAKRDRLAVREFEWDAVQTAYLWVDDSASMSYSSNPKTVPTKLVAARVLALALANLMTRGGESVGSLDMTVKPGSNKRKIEELADWLSDVRNIDFPSAGPNAQNEVPSYAQQVWLGDFLMPVDQLKAQLSQQTKRRQCGVLVQVVDPSERSLPFKGRTKFSGFEGEEDWTIQKTEDVTDVYAKRWREHCDTLMSLSQAAGWSLVQVNTAEALSVPLSKLYGLLSAGARR